MCHCRLCSEVTSNGKKIFTNGQCRPVTHINAYLLAAPDIWIASRTNNKPNWLPKIEKGSEPCDGGNLLLTPEEATYLSKKYPNIAKYIRKFTGGNEAINSKPGEVTRYCLWFLHGNPSDYAKNSEISKRLQSIRTLRSSSSADRIRKKSDEPYLFCQIRQPKSDYIIIPRHSTSSRSYIPMAYTNKDIICGDSAYILASESRYLFGILNSNVHNAWCQTICGRLGMAYRYSPAIYNNFPWPTPTEQQKAKIEQTAQAILDARALYPDSSLADLYDDNLMPVELRKAHHANNRAVMQAYGFNADTMSESSIVAELMKLYQQKVSDLSAK